jgi:hypothetical protein
MKKKIMALIISLMSINMIFVIVAVNADISSWVLISVSAIIAATMIIVALILTRKKDQK